MFDGAGEELALFKRSGKEVGVVWCDFSAAKKFKILGKAVSFLSVNWVIKFRDLAFEYLAIISSIVFSLCFCEVQTPDISILHDYMHGYVI